MNDNSADTFLIVCDVRDTRYCRTKTGKWCFYRPGMNDHLHQKYTLEEGKKTLNELKIPASNAVLSMISC